MLTTFLSFDKAFVGSKTAGVLVVASAGTLAPMEDVKDPFSVAFSVNLRAAMDAANIPTASALAKMIRAGESRVRNWCNGTSSPTAKEAVQLAEFLGVTLDWLFRGVSDGLVEAKRIRVVAAKQGFTPPPQMDDHEVDGAFSGEAAPAPVQRRVRIRTKATVR